jgi:acyl-coenzyme A synthetase/AMP-(fatty) acid ligase
VNAISKDPYWSEIEQVIRSFEALQECAVIGVANDD